MRRPAQTRQAQIDRIIHINKFLGRPWPHRLELAMKALWPRMACRGYASNEKPRVRCFTYKSSGKSFFVIRLTNQGNERRKDVYIHAERWETMIQKLFFGNWRPYRGSMIERRWK